MRINKKKCKLCRKCIPYCPVEAIKLENKEVIIDQALCVECGVCYRSGVCEYKALIPLNRRALKIVKRLIPQLYHIEKARIIRQILSDPNTASPLSKVAGRGTEEVKTNDVTKRYQWGEIGFCIEVGRPGVGATIKEIEKFTVELAKLGVHFEPQNPITWMMKDSSGYLREKYLAEKVASSIIEFTVKENEINKVLDFIKQFDHQAETVFTVGVISPMKPDGTVPILGQIEHNGFQVSSNSKVNLGLGRVPN